MLAGEQRAQLESVELLGERGDPGRDLRLLRRVAFLACELRERVEVVEGRSEALDQLDVFTQPRQLGGDLARRGLVVPQVGLRDLLFERRDLLPRCRC